jgi:ribosome-associated translation inhibitor RaiA
MERMELTVTGEGAGVMEEYVAERVKRLKRMFASEPDISVRFDTADGEKVVAEVVVSIRGYRTLKACSKGDDARGALDKAFKRLEWKYKLFWARGSFRFGDCC